MKKIYFIIGITLPTLISFNAQAQKHEIQINALGTLVQYYGVTYERSYTNTGWATGLFFHESSPSFKEFKAFSLTSEYRFYFSENDDATGYYAAPYLNYRYTITPKHTTVNTVDIKRTTNGLALGVTVGKKWANKTGFTYGTHIGIGRYLFDEIVYSNNFDPNQYGSVYTSKFDFRFGINLGFRF